MRLPEWRTRRFLSNSAWQSCCRRNESAWARRNFWFQVRVRGGSSVVIMKPITGYPEYRAGNDGFIYSAWKRGGPSRWHISDGWTRLKSRPSNCGYPEVGLKRNGKQEWKTVHGLVALAWLGPTPAGHEIRHEDSNRLNSRPGNLSFATHVDNCADVGGPGNVKLLMMQLRRLRSAS
jgi:HNH endonuclease